MPGRRDGFAEALDDHNRSLIEGLAIVGIEVTLEKVPAANWRSEMGKKSMPFLINDMGGWLNYPEYFFFWNYHGQNATFNVSSYVNPEMDKWIDSARFETDQKKYAEDVREHRFPEEQHTYAMPDEELALFEAAASDRHEHAEDRA